MLIAHSSVNSQPNVRSELIHSLMEINYPADENKQSERNKDSL